MSKTFIGLGLTLFLVGPISGHAQDSSSGAPTPVDTEAPTEASPSPDSSAADTASSSSSDSTESSSSDSSSSDSGSQSASAGSTLYKLYAGVDRVEAKLKVESDALQQGFQGDGFDGGFYRARAGIRLAPGISVEAQGGAFPDHANSGDQINFRSFYGTYLVTTGTILDTVEISGRLGYAWLRASNYHADEHFDSVSFGAEFALPLRVFSEKLPDIRFTLGGTVLTVQTEDRSYGWSGGLRYDFDLSGFHQL